VPSRSLLAALVLSFVLSLAFARDASARHVRHRKRTIIYTTYVPAAYTARPVVVIAARPRHHRRHRRVVVLR